MYDSNTNDNYFEKSVGSGCLYLEKVNDFVFDGMICNYKNAVSKQNEGIRIREYEDFLIIEPSGIKVPKKQMKLLISDNEGNERYSNIFSEISSDTFFCNFISDFSRGGRIKIPYNEVEQLKENFIKGNIDNDINKSFLTSFDFMYMFSFINYKNNNFSFNRDNLIEYIVAMKKNPEFIRILWNVKVYRHEHYDLLPSLDLAISLLRYIGVLYPNYSKENPYIDLNIDENLTYLQTLFNEKKVQYPEMKKFVKLYNKYITKNKQENSDMVKKIKRIKSNNKKGR